MDLKKDNESLFKNSALYQEFLAEREEILRHKWIESEKAGYDVGFEKALLDWIVNHRASWRRQRQTLLHQRGEGSANVSALLAASSAITLTHHVLQGFLC
ncbi:MAG: hypothetical protein PW734_00485 [Verrucomicrobium sp.]|nr:hypothetical protein [Verrucomicrobium sp.]